MIRVFEIVRCLRCGHVWDDEDMDDEVCACINNFGHRTVEVVSSGATNMPYRMVLS